MPMQLAIRTGDGINTTLVDAVVVLPDSGHSYALSGVVKAPGLAAQAITGSPLTGPNNPGSGTITWQIVVDTTSGAASVIQTATATAPAPADEGPKAIPLTLSLDMPAAKPVGRAAAPGDASTSVVIFQQQLTSGSPSAPWQNTTNVIPNQY